MKIFMISMGHKMPTWLKEGFEEYQKRFPKESPLNLIEIPPKKNQGKNLLKEFIEKIPEKSHIIALDEHGECWDTPTLAKQLKQWKTLGKNIVFLIGGSDGLDKTLLDSADQCWSLSPLTFPHMLVRVLAAEQLYRAFSILSGHPYHRV